METISEQKKQAIANHIKHIFDSGANEIRVIEAVETHLRPATELLAKIEAFLCFNTTPDPNETKKVRKAITDFLNG